MVSFWPFGASDSESPAHFEKVLAGISEKISTTTSRLEAQLRRSRRWKVVWTLYTTFAYTLYAIIATYVLGRKQWGVVEYTIMSAAPVTIYLIRVLLASFFSYQVSKTQRSLEALNDERATTIEKLKEATKYNSTQKLLKKYGASPPASPTTTVPKGRTASSGRKNGKRDMERRDNQFRTNLPPPPTANIRQPDEFQARPQSNASGGQVHSPAPNIIHKPGGGPPATTFPYPTPNPGQPMHPGTPSLQGFPPRSPTFPHGQPKNIQAQYPTYPQQQQQQQQRQRQPQPPYEPRWYDRFIDALLGEDETSPKNRIALLCRNCRTVNGLAPPGVASADGVGIWRCMYCQEWNGDGSDKMSDAGSQASPLDGGKRIPSHQSEDGARDKLHGRQRSMSHPVSTADGLVGSEPEGEQEHASELADHGKEVHEVHEKRGKTEGGDIEEKPDDDGEAKANKSEGEEKNSSPSGASSPPSLRLRSKAA